MRVNSFSKILRSQATKLIGAMAIGVCVTLVLAGFITERSTSEVISKRVNIAIRAIGHHLLLQSGDSTSVVRPVIEKSNGVFLLQFENELVFQPDTLVALVQRLLAKTTLNNYTVTVHECHKSEIVYGFEINPPNNSIKACLGRVQPKACYNIEIAFADFPGGAIPSRPISNVIASILLGLFVVLIGWNVLNKKKKALTQHNPKTDDENSHPITLGQFTFSSLDQYLKIGDETILLTDKECKILTLLNRNVGQLTLREELVQEVWTDEGVITSRSLDMFISKLRKKLSGDPDLRITNVHGKGYRLEVVNNTTSQP